MPPPIMTTSAEDLTSVSLTSPRGKRCTHRGLDRNIKHVNFTGPSIGDGITSKYPFLSVERSNITLGRSGARARGFAIYSIKKPGVLAVPIMFLSCIKTGSTFGWIEPWRYEQPTPSPPI